MRQSYTLHDVIRLYEQALAGADLHIAGTPVDLGVLARQAAIAHEATQSPVHHVSDRYTVLRSLGNGELAQRYALADNLFELLGLTPPSPQEFAEAGADWGALCTAFDSETLREGDPALIIAPVLPLTAHASHAGALDWQRIYAQIASTTQVAANPLRDRPDGSGLHINASVVTDGVVAQLFTSEQQLAAADHTNVTGDDGTVWTLSVIAQAENEARGNHPHTAFAGLHVRLSEYLTLQLLRIYDAKPPLDEFSWSWIEGTFTTDGGSRALTGVWVAAYGQVRLYTNPVGYAQARLQVRAPVRA